jgi:hypothetical protein
MTARTPNNMVPLAAQSRDDPVPYSLPARITSGVPSPCSAWRRRRSTSVAGRHVHGHATFGARREQVAQADVGEVPRIITS